MNVDAEVIQRAINGGGGLTKFASKCGVSLQAISKWRKKGVPPKRVLFVEKLSGVSRHELRPDLYPLEDSLLTTRRRRA